MVTRIVTVIHSCYDDKEKFIQISLRSTFNYPRHHGGDDDQDQDVKKL